MIWTPREKEKENNVCKVYCYFQNCAYVYTWAILWKYQAHLHERCRVLNLSSVPSLG